MNIRCPMCGCSDTYGCDTRDGGIIEGYLREEYICPNCGTLYAAYAEIDNISFYDVVDYGVWFRDHGD